MVRISVLVSCHGRRNFVLEALDSVLKQDYDPGKFEIILVKNFPDDEIDRFCTDNGIRTASEGGTLGDKMAAGIDISTGEILCFLDDDDLFMRNKLSSVEHLFSKYPDVIYIHNRPVMFSGERFHPDENRQTSESSVKAGLFHGTGDVPKNAFSMIREKAHWYASCMSVRREFALRYVQKLRDIPASYDKLWFFSALNEGGTLISVSDRLTGYRIHDSLTTVKGDRGTFLKRKEQFYRRSLESVSKMKLDFRANRTVQMALDLEEKHEKVMVSFFSSGGNNEIKTGDIVNYSILSLRYRMFRNLAWSVLRLMSLVAPGISRSIFYRLTMGSYSL